MCHGICQLKFYEGAKQRINDKIMAKPYDQIITLIESYIESPKPECRKLNQRAEAQIRKGECEIGNPFAVNVH